MARRNGHRRFSPLILPVLALLWDAGLARADDTEDAAAGSLRLRGGIDANPRLLPDGKPSAFAGIEGAFAIGRETRDLMVGLTGEIAHIEYAKRGLDPSERYNLSLDAESTAVEGWSLRSGLSLGNERSATVHAFDANLRLRAQWTGGAVRPFLAAEAGFHTLNETNAILIDFLPDPQRFGRVALTPGVTLALGELEVGASLAASATRYTETFDLFGYRRDNERLQPFLFARYEGQGLSLAASVSQLYGTWRDVDFAKVGATLYDVSLTRTQGPFTLELGASRFAEETSFPISPITLNESWSARLAYEPDARWTLGAIVRGLRTRYLDSPFATSAFAYGVSASYALSKDWEIGAEAMRVQATAITGEPADGGIAMLSLTRRLSAEGARRRQAPEVAPAAARWSPRSLKP